MSIRSTVRLFVSGCSGVGLLFAAGCQGPLAPTPDFGTAARPNRTAMIENPDAPQELKGQDVEGLHPTTAKIVVENYDRNQKVENQERRHRNQARGIDVEY